MKAKLKVIKDWEFEEFELTGTSFKYSPTGCKGMVARSEDEIVFWTYHLAQKCSGVLWVKGEVSRWIPSPEPKEQQDVWEDLRWMESGLQSPWIIGVPRVFPSLWLSLGVRAFSLLCAE